MSQRWLNLVRDAGPDHPETCALVRALADFANDYGVAWPSMPTLATYLRVTERTAYRRVAAAREDGWITVRSGGGRRRSNTYTLVAERFSRLMPEPLSTTPGNPDRNPVGNGDRNPDAGVTLSTETLTPVSLNPDAGVRGPTGTPTTTTTRADDALPFVVGVAAAAEREPTTKPDDVRAALAAVLDGAHVPETARPDLTAKIRLALRAAFDKGHDVDSFAAVLAGKRLDYSRVGPGLVADVIEGIAAGPVRRVATTPAVDPGPACWECGLSEADCRRRERTSGHRFRADVEALPVAAAGGEKPATTNGQARPAVNGHRTGFNADGWVDRFKARTT